MNEEIKRLKKKNEIKFRIKRKRKENPEYKKKPYLARSVAEATK